MKWEKIDDYMILWRAKVPGGWLVATEAKDFPSRNPAGIAFVPDVKHEWKVDTEVKVRGLEN